MDGQSAVNPGGAAVAAPAGDSGAASPTAQPGAPAPTGASPSGTQPGASAQPRTYSTEDMSKAVQSRLAEERTRWEKQYGSPAELQARRE